ncbi:MAG: aldehyde dehydrogenase family protein [Ignavibacteriae bacterium]|nr:aldehyde dehydrogenase family protein [Ignavibacteriota bacterium]
MSTRIEIPKMYKLFIGGKFARTESERYIEVINPKTKDKICNISRASRKDVRNSVVSARSGFSSWSSKSGYERGQILYRFAEMLEGRKEQFIEEIYISTLRTKSECRNEVSKAIDRIIYYAGFADKWMQLISSVNPVQEGYFNFSVPEPVGVVGVILPDNLSFLPLVSRILVILTTGNSCVIIANEKSPLPSLTLSEVIATSDFPSGVINLLTGQKSELISHLAGHFDINAIDYCEETGNNRKLIKELCANNVKRFYETGNSKSWNWFSDKQNENFKEIEKFTELKTVWQSA